MLDMNTALESLAQLGRPEQLEGMARYGLTGDGRLGVSMPEIRKLAKKIGKDHGLALELWASRIPDAMILASLVDDPRFTTEEQAERWIVDVASWDVCDQLCMNLLDKTPFADTLVFKWSKRDEEFVRRAAFALIASVAWHDKQASDERLKAFLPVIKEASSDGRNYVKKAVSWALRHIGKKNRSLNAAALETALEIKAIGNPSARWIASDVIRELESEAVKKRIGHAD